MSPPLHTLAIADAGYGYDRFGMSQRAVELMFAGAWPIYRYYFRAESDGVERVPRSGPAIVISNHSGMLPYDGLMIWTDVVHRLRRVLRPLADHSVGGLPFIGTMLQRMGAVGGSSGNARALLEAGEALLVFPEGVPGISKPFRDRYHLRTWRPGHVELALRHNVPVVPVAVIGAEEQFPVVKNSRALGRMVGSPHVPITFFPVPVLPVPLPVKYRIHYGEPMRLRGDPDDPRAVHAAAEQTKEAVQTLIDEGIRRRRGVFR